MEVRYASMLRGVNVGGHRRVKMEDLRSAYTSIGLRDVKTYLQSGNVVFREPTGEDESIVVRSIRDAISERLKLDGVSILLRPVDELTRIVKNSPFGGRDESKLHITFLEGRPEAFPLEEIDKARRDGEEYRFLGREVYLYLPYGYGRTKLSNNFFESKLEMPATTRNWNTVRALLELMGA